MKRMRWLALVAVLALIAGACASEGGDETTTTAGDEATTTAAEGTTTSVATTEAPSDLLTLDSGGCDYGGKINTIEATSASEVVFTLCAPDPAFLVKIAFVPFSVQPSEHLEATAGSPLENPVGTGPFMLPEGGWTRGSQIVFEANPDYWDGAPAFDTLVFQWREDSTARITELVSGNADYITNLAASDYAGIEGDANLQLLVDNNPNVFYMGMNNQFPPFDNPQVRQAIALGIDRQRIIDTFYPEGSEVATHFTPCIMENACEGPRVPRLRPRGSTGAALRGRIPRRVRDHHLPPRCVPGIPPGADGGGRGHSGPVGREPGDRCHHRGGGIWRLHRGGQRRHDRRDPSPRLGCRLPACDQLHRLSLRCVYPGFGVMNPDITAAVIEGSGTVDPAAAQPIYEQVNTLLTEDVPMVPIAWGAAADAGLTSLEGALTPPFGHHSST